ncbi:MAG: hypothetical protein ACYSO2_06990, partial [Planctomycetota bacterium]
FSQFTQKTTLGTVDFLVGYTGADNVQIDPADLLSDYSQGIGAAGQVTFFSAASTVTGDNDLYWDDTNKRLGIGTTSPSSKLHVKDDFNNSSQLALEGNTPDYATIRVENDNTTTGSYASLFLRADTGDSRIAAVKKSNASNDVDVVFMLDDTSVSAMVERLRIVGDTGNVGIGTNSPVARLQVEGSFISSGISQLGSAGANVYLTSSSAGNVGIGDNSPTAKLVVNNVGTKMLELKRGGNIKLRVLADSNDGQLNMFNSGTSNKVRLHTNGDSYFTGGNVGIGTSSPTDKLDIAGAARFTSNITFDSGKAGRIYKASNHGLAIHGVTGTENDFAMFTPTGMLKIVVPTGTNNLILNRDNGNVGIGTSSPTEKLDVQGENI